MKRIMILGGSLAQLPMVLEAKKLGYEVISCDMYDDAPCFEYADLQEVVSTTDYEGLKKVIEKYRPAGITTIASDRPMPILARLAKEYNLTAVNLEAAVNATNKYKMRTILKKCGVSVPNFKQILSLEELKASLHEFSYPFILKPTDNSGSRGVTLIRCEAELESSFQYAYQYAVTRELLMEEYMQGPEVSVESFVNEVNVQTIQITDKMTTGAPHFVEMGHAEPSSLDQEVKQQIIELVQAAAKALHIDKGPMHTEVIVTSNGPKIVEVGVRLGGDNIASDLVPLSTGYNMVRATLHFAAGDENVEKVCCNQGSAIKFISAKPGKISSIKGAEEIRNLPGFVCLALSVKPGDCIGEIVNSATRIGYLIFTGADGESASRQCDAGLQALKVEYES